MNKSGRNDPCPCGSGAKYKKCCLPPSFAGAEVLDLSWRQLRQTEGSVVDKHLIPYVIGELPKEVVKTALIDFFPEDMPESMDEELLFNQMFIPWLLFNWIPFEDFGIKGFEPEATVAENYLKLNLNKLSKNEKAFIGGLSRSYYSFYCVVEVKFEESLVVRDILLGMEHIIKERKGTHTLKPGDIVLSRILTLANQSIFVGMAPYIIPARYHTDVINFREWLIEEANDGHQLDQVVLRDFDIELLDCFFEVMETIFNKPLPVLCNTDGELIQFSKTYFRLEISPEEALKKILPLSLSNDAEEFLSAAKRDKAGKIQHLELPWLKKGNKRHKEWTNTLMGNLVIEKGRLVLETNSDKRAERGKKLLEKHLGEMLYFQKRLIETPEQKKKSLPQQSVKNAPELDLLESLELQEQVKQMAKAHWENWLNEPIPMLDNQTPREAVKTAIGREKLEALLVYYEQQNVTAERDSSLNLLKPDISYLKTQLGLI